MTEQHPGASPAPDPIAPQFAPQQGPNQAAPYQVPPTGAGPDQGPAPYQPQGAAPYQQAPPQGGTPPYQQAPPQGGAPYQGVSDEQRRIWENKGKRSIAFGAVWLLAGLLITGITYSNASGGGVYVVAWGPAVYGIIRIISGVMMLNKSKR